MFNHFNRLKAFKATMTLLKPRRWMLLLLAPTPAFADSGATLETVLQNLTNYLNSTLARVMGVLIIVIAGYLCLFVHRLPKDKFFMIAVGLGLIYGGSSLFTMLTGMS